MIPLLLFGCAGGDDDSGRVAPTGPASIEILSPTDESTICGTPLAIELAVEGLELVAPVADPSTAKPNTGHVDTMLNGQESIMVWAESYEVPDLADGLYQLKVELSSADHTPIEPYAGDFVYITVSAAVCETDP
jgi:hypothetical protein